MFPIINLTFLIGLVRMGEWIWFGVLALSLNLVWGAGSESKFHNITGEKVFRIIYLIQPS